jgi:hypothetical protein
MPCLNQETLMNMKKYLVISAALALGAVVGGANCSGGPTSCTTDTDCTDATTPLCSDGVCVPVECTSDTECLVDDAGGSASCGSDGDCTDAGDRCLKGSNDTGHCVAEQGAGDQACADQDPPTTQFAGTDIDGSSVNFCDSTGAKCEDDGKCSGVSS